MEAGVPGAKPVQHPESFQIPFKHYPHGRLLPSRLFSPTLAVKFQGKAVPNADYIFLGPSQLLANEPVPFPRKLFLNFI